MQHYPSGPEDDFVLHIISVEARPLDDEGVYAIYLNTSRGSLTARLHVAEGAPGAVVFAVRGTPETPRAGIQSELAAELTEHGVSSLLLFFRVPQAEPPGFNECVLDMLGAVNFLRGIGARRIAIVGHSFGGGVVINAGALSQHVSAVVAMSSQLFGARHNAEKIAPRPLLLLHGEDDVVLETESSHIIYGWAGEPKELVTYPEMGHALDGPHRGDLKELLKDRLIKYVGPAAFAGPEGD